MKKAVVGFPFLLGGSCSQLVRGRRDATLEGDDKEGLLRSKSADDARVRVCLAE